MENRSFADRLAALISNEMVLAKNNPERMADALERVASALGFTVAVMARGDAKAIDTLMTGAESYAHEEAVKRAPIVAMMLT